MEFLGLDEEFEESSSGKLVVNTSKIFIGNLPFKVTNLELTELFCGFGRVVGVNHRKDRSTDKSKGFAFITFDTPAAAAAAIENMNGKTFEGRVLSVKTALARGQSAGTSLSMDSTEKDGEGWATAPPPRRNRGGNGGHGGSHGGRKKDDKKKSQPKSWTQWTTLPEEKPKKKKTTKATTKATTKVTKVTTTPTAKATAKPTNPTTASTKSITPTVANP